MASIKRLSVRLPNDLYSDVKYQARQDGYSLNRLIQLACQHYLDWAHHNFDVPSLDRRRVNQLVDGQKALKDTCGRKLDAILRGQATLLAFTHGSNYYNDKK